MIDPGDKDKHDLLWHAGRLSNSAIGAYFGLTNSAVSRISSNCEVMKIAPNLD